MHGPNNGCQLQELLQFYKNSPTPGDQWRVMGYNKAISALKNHPKEITTWEVCVIAVFVCV